MDFNVTREQWIDRFVVRFAQREAGTEPGAFVALASALWSTRGQLDPEAAADGERDARRNGGDASAFASTQQFPAEAEDFERTVRIPVERGGFAGEYVRDTDEWIARCVARVLELDPIIRADEARRSVVDLAQLERWRLMKPEAAADQLYTPISRPS